MGLSQPISCTWQASNTPPHGKEIEMILKGESMYIQFSPIKGLHMLETLFMSFIGSKSFSRFYV
jgi:hypothetical protein